MSVPERLSKMPLSAPLYVWVVYALLIGALCVVSGGLWPLVASAFSFQFWVFACWRGLKLAEGKDDSCSTS